MSCRQRSPALTPLKWNGGCPNTALGNEEADESVDEPWSESHETLNATAKDNFLNDGKAGQMIV
jgi:hypothetical protein